MRSTGALNNCRKSARGTLEVDDSWFNATKDCNINSCGFVEVALIVPLVIGLVALVSLAVALLVSWTIAEVLLKTSSIAWEKVWYQ